MTIFQICKDLLSKYTPSSQWNIVWDYLLPTCPHPGLKPKLLDMLRPLLVSAAAVTPDVRTRLRRDLETVLSRDLGKFVVLGSNNNNNQIQGFQNVPELIDQCEFFVAVCGLIQLAWRHHQKMQSGGDELLLQHPRTIAIQPSEAPNMTYPLPTLGDLGQALRDQLETWNKAANGDAQTPEPPDEFFRLDLLVMAIQLILDVP
eukprot:Sro365_g127330.2  (203) ;mRNA; r:22284-22892